jgi:hypothetical protein
MPGFSIPDYFPLGDLITQELANVSIGRHYVRLQFVRSDGTVAGGANHQNGAAVEIEAGFQLETNDGQTVSAENADLSTGAAALIELLGQTVVSVNRRPNNQLSLIFSDKAVLLLTVDEQGFESYHLHIGGQTVDVTKEW